MGCVTSKPVKADIAADVYLPAPTSFSRFDVNSIEEPWLKGEKQQEEEQEEEEKSIIMHVPTPVHEKLNTFEHESNGLHSWSEVSKVLEELKPNLHQQKTVLSKPNLVSQQVKGSPTTIKKPLPTPKKSSSFHTLEELESKISSNSPELNHTESFTKTLKKTELKKTEPKSTESGLSVLTNSGSNGRRPVKENLFVLRDRLEREGKNTSNLDWIVALKSKPDPLSEYPDKCPPGGLKSVVLYTTTLRGIRKTFEDCNRVRSMIEGQQVVFDERDVSLHSEFLTELKDLVGERMSVPRLFVKGRYLGGVDEVLELNESSRLSELLKSVERGPGFVACEGCGGARFVPCFECGGSCKIIVEDKKERCPKCNENGLLQCPVCH